MQCRAAAAAAAAAQHSLIATPFLLALMVFLLLCPCSDKSFVVDNVLASSVTVLFLLFVFSAVGVVVVVAVDASSPFQTAPSGLRTPGLA